MEQALTNRTGTAGQGKREEEGEKGKRVEKGELTAGGGEERIRQASLRQGMAQRVGEEREKEERARVEV